MIYSLNFVCHNLKIFLLKPETKVHLFFIPLIRKRLAKDGMAEKNRRLFFIYVSKNPVFTNTFKKIS